MIWRRRGRRSRAGETWLWLSGSLLRDDDEETRAKIRKRKLHRTKAYEWLLAVSHMVLIATGSQLTRYQQVEDKAARKDPATWPCATVCIDQGSDGWSACHWLIHLRHNILLLHDWCHRVWNNVELAIADMGWRYTVLLGVIMLNLDHGPWAGHKWFAEMVAGAEEYIRVFQQRRPHLCFLAPKHRAGDWHVNGGRQHEGAARRTFSNR